MAQSKIVPASEIMPFAAALIKVNQMIDHLALGELCSRKDICIMLATTTYCPLHSNEGRQGGSLSIRPTNDGV
ncbi:uncharacterized protein BDW70DRAFT_131715 [Aspergillus foveolatus]|uniref:uncharacterized protein n=1 Tax=Aspergillus foveolatus TaxID=210207 RepID=UPI003CCE32D2